MSFSKLIPKINLLANSAIINKPRKLGAALGAIPAFNKFNKFVEYKSDKGSAERTYHSNNYMPVVFNDNVHNEYQALKSRVVVATPPPNLDLLRALTLDVLDRRNFSQLFPGMRKISTDEIVEKRYSELYPHLLPYQAAYLCRSNAQGGVKKKLEKCFIKLNNDGIFEGSYLPHKFCQRATYRSAFLKIENLLYRSPVGCKIKAPRFINGAEAEFICLIGPWMMAFQDRLKKSWDKDHFITFCSGLSAEQAGSICEQQEGKRVFEDDVGLFDVSVSSQLLKLECDIFRRCGAPRGVLKLVQYNINTRGRTKFGFKYKVPGMRKSGDPYTSSGNSIINGLLHYYIYKVQHGLTTGETIKQLKMLVMGDDNLGFCTQFCDWVNYMLDFGFNSEAKFHTSILDAEFCSSRVYPTNDGLILGPKPGKVLAKLGVFADPPEKVERKSLLKGVALGLYKQCSFIPPIKIMLDKVLQYTANVESVEYKSNDEWQFRATKIHKPTVETWSLLNRVYGFSKSDAIHMEANVPVEPSHLEFPYLERLFDIDTSGPKQWFSDGSSKGFFPLEFM